MNVQGRSASGTLCFEPETRRESLTSRERLEKVWAWASLVVLILCWDAALRLDERVSLPRVRFAHAEAEEARPANTEPAEWHQP